MVLKARGPYLQCSITSTVVPGFFHRYWRLVGDAADLVTGLLCFLHPFAKTRWVLISLNLRKLFQYGKETAQHSAAFLAPRTAPSTQELSQNVLLVCPCCSFVTTMCLSIWYWKTASVTCLSMSVCQSGGCPGSWEQWQPCRMHSWSSVFSFAGVHNGILSFKKAKEL